MVAAMRFGVCLAFALPLLAVCAPSGSCSAPGCRSSRYLDFMSVKRWAKQDAFVMTRRASELSAMRVYVTRYSKSDDAVG
jgi:hypothetical protein